MEMSYIIGMYHKTPGYCPPIITSRVESESRGVMYHMGVRISICTSYLNKVQTAIPDPQHGNKNVKANVTSGSRLTRAGPKWCATHGHGPAIGVPADVTRPQDGTCDKTAQRGNSTAAAHAYAGGHETLYTSGSSWFTFLVGEAFEAMASATISDAFTFREMMMGLVAVRQEHDTSKCECFDPAQLSAIRKEVMDKRHRTIVLDAGDGNKMEVGTALRNKRMQKENSRMQTKMKSRLARLSTVSKVTSAVATPLSTTGFLKQGHIFIVSVCHHCNQEAIWQDVAVQQVAAW